MRIILATLMLCLGLALPAHAREIGDQYDMLQPADAVARHYVDVHMRGIERVPAARAANYDRVSAAAAAAGVPVNIAHAVVRMESNYNQNCRSPSGAIGIMQVLRNTARAMGENPYTLEGNLAAGMKYLALALASSPNLCAAVSGYNHGIVGRPYCTSYGRRVLMLARQ